MRKHETITAFRPILAAVAAAAAAAVMAGSVESAQAHPPPLFWMPDLSPHSRVGVELFAGVSNEVPADPLVLSGAAVGQFAVTDSLSVTGRVPFTYVSFTDLAGEDHSALALGNAGVGLHFARTNHSSRDSATLLGGGIFVSLPTASDEGDAGTAVALMSDFSVPDISRFFPGVTTIRLHGDGRIESGILFLQGQLGLDLHIGDDTEEDLVFGVGGGVTLSHYFALLAELTTISGILNDNGGEDWVHALDLGLRWHNPSVMVGFRVYVPLDETFRNDDVIGIGADIAARF